jgi:glycerophosphoryl diester phosphodiesterase
VKVYAHRGSSAEYPENTLLAFGQAIADGVDGIELDLHGAADGVPVVIHDRDLERTTNGAGYVDQQSLADLRRLDAGRGERIPTLAEVVDLVGDGIHLDLEIKGSGIEHAVLDVLSQYPGSRWAISSFDWNVLLAVRRLAGGAELWPLAEQSTPELFEIAAELASPVVALHVDAFNAASAAELRRAGLEAMIWTVNDPATARRARDLGALAICTDDPRTIIQALRDA